MTITAFISPELTFTNASPSMPLVAPIYTTACAPTTSNPLLLVVGNLVAWTYVAPSDRVITDIAQIEHITYNPHTCQPVRVHLVAQYPVLLPDHQNPGEYLEGEEELDVWVDPGELEAVCVECYLRAVSPGCGQRCGQCEDKAKGLPDRAACDADQNILLPAKDYNLLLDTLEAVNDYLSRYGTGHGIEQLIEQLDAATAQTKAALIRGQGISGEKP